jgi:signal transduction histidine kinase
MAAVHLLELDADDPAAVRAHAAQLRAALDRYGALMARVGRALRRTPGPGDDTTCDLADVAAAALAASSADAVPCDPDGRGATPAVALAVESHGALPVRGRAADLRLAVAHLLDNARRATAAGGRVTVRLWSEAGEGCCAVSDAGDGMAPEEVAVAGEPFVRGGRWPGLGLGLAETAGIVQRLGGRLLLETAPGRGTTVTIRLPLVTGH